MNYNIYKAVNNHEFLIDEKNVEFLNIEDCVHTYQIIERVFLNVSAKRGIDWKSIYHAKEEHGKLYSDLIVCLILIEKYLKQQFSFSDEEVINIIGYQFYEILESYQTYLSK